MPDAARQVTAGKPNQVIKARLEQVVARAAPAQSVHHNKRLEQVVARARAWGQPAVAAGCGLGSGRIVASEIEAPNRLVKLV